MKAIAIKPAVINVIPKPLNPAGTSEYFNFSRTAAIKIKAIAQPEPDQIP